MVDNAPDKIYEDEIDTMKRPKKRETTKKAAIADVVVVEEKPETVVEKSVDEPAKPKAPKGESSKEMRLRFGQTADKKPIYISEKARYANVLIIGAKNSGKSSTVLPALARQDILNGECGVTFVVDKKDVAYTLYAMAKEEGRHVTILKPSADFDIANDFIQRTKYDYEFINDHVINYKEAIKKKEVVIIDMEYAKYRQNAIRATAMLLMQLQIDMQDTQATLKRPHFVYIDDANRYLPFIELLLTSGDDYGMGTILLMQGRSQLNTYETDYASLIDVNVRNTILMNGIAFEDAKFYSERFFDMTLRDVVDRKEGQILYEIIDNSFARSSGQCGLVFISETIRKSIEDKAKKARKQLNKFSRKIELEISMKEEVELNKLNKLKLEAITRSAHEYPSEDSSRIARDIIAVERKAVEAKREEFDESEETTDNFAPIEATPVEPVSIEYEEPVIPDAEKILASLAVPGHSAQPAPNDFISQLEGLNDANLPDDGFGAYESEDEPIMIEAEEEDSDASVIMEARKLMVEPDEEEGVIELNDTISVDSMGDDYLQQVRGYRPIKANMPRKKGSIIASELYMNNILNKKLK